MWLRVITWLGTLVTLGSCTVRNEPHRSDSVIVFRMDDRVNFDVYPPVPDAFFFTVDIALPGYYELGLLPVLDLRSYVSVDTVSNCSNILNATRMSDLRQLVQQHNYRELEQQFSRNGWDSRTTAANSNTGAIFQDGSVQWRWNGTFARLLACRDEYNGSLLHEIFGSFYSTFCVMLLDIKTGHVRYVASYEITWFADSTHGRGHYESEVMPGPFNSCLED